MGLYPVRQRQQTRIHPVDDGWLDQLASAEPDLFVQMLLSANQQHHFEIDAEESPQLPRQKRSHK